MAENRGSESTERHLDDRGGHVSVTTERTSEGTVYRTEPRLAAAPDRAVIERHSTTVEPRDRIRWGPILAGLIATIASMLVLTVLGLALGASVFEPTSDGSDVGTAAAIWSALSGLLSFLFGGWIAGRTAAVSKNENALLNGFMVGATALALILWLTSTGLGNLLGGIGSNVADIAAIGQAQVSGSEVDSAAQNARQTAVEAYDEARNGAWGTLAGLALALGASTVGGLLGHKAKSAYGEATGAEEHS